MNFKLHLETPLEDGPRVRATRELFDLPLSEKLERDWDVQLPLEERDWIVGLIVGPSGSGKSKIARALWPDNFAENYVWSPTRAVVEDFPADLSADDVTYLLSNVGFSSPPQWLAPFHTLSNGEQFRATLARALVDDRDPIVIDEFTSVVDRTVAQVGSAAFARAARRIDKRRVVLLSCHYDVIDWLQPDWCYYPDAQQFEWRSLQRRPDVQLEVRRCSHAVWDVFRQHHYLTAKLPGTAHCFVGTVNERLACFVATCPWPISKYPFELIRHVSRVVTLPDFQGIGLGKKMTEFVASLWKTRNWRVTLVTSHPSMRATLSASPSWSTNRKYGNNTQMSATSTTGRCWSVSRRTQTFEYVGPRDDIDTARAFEVPPN